MLHISIRYARPDRQESGGRPAASAQNHVEGADGVGGDPLRLYHQLHVATDAGQPCKQGRGVALHVRSDDDYVHFAPVAREQPGNQSRGSGSVRWRTVLVSGLTRSMERN